ncbi:MAG: hypothetical protein AB7F64_07920 [Gammaproteobacteria bacterium]
MKSSRISFTSASTKPFATAQDKEALGQVGTNASPVLPNDDEIAFEDDDVPPVSSTLASGIVKLPEDKFSSIEHVGIGTIALKTFFETHEVLDHQLRTAGLYDSTTGQMKLSDSLWLTGGQVVALAGDFYGIPKEPISFGVDDKQKRKRFRNAYRTLSGADGNEVKKLLEEIEEERQDILKAVRSGKKPSIGLERHSGKGNRHYSKITQYTFLPFSFLYSRYIDLAKMNYDHFSEQAKEALRAGYLVAIKTARKAAVASSDQERLEGLMLAFTRILFACHFFTDLFSSGHMRTPRKALLEYVHKNSSGKVAGGTIAGLLTMSMHDEDNAQGLYVCSDAYPEGWKAYGDHCFYDVDNRDNASCAHEAVTKILEEIYQAYLNPNNEPTFAYEKYLPRVAMDNRNSNPLFKVERDTVKRRKDIDDLLSDEYIGDWSPVKTLAALKTRRKFSQMENTISDEDRRLLEDELEDLALTPDEEVHYRRM